MEKKVFVTTVGFHFVADLTELVNMYGGFFMKTFQLPSMICLIL